MKQFLFVAPLSLIITLFLMPANGSAQILDRIFGKATEGSRPGQTYQTGQSEMSRRQNQANPQQASRPDGNAPIAMPPPPIPRREFRPGMPVIMEFSDLQCPDSARYNSGLKNTVMQRFVTTGKAAYEWHDFPLPSHSQAIEAAAAARCGRASAQQIRQKIMANQAQMSPAMYTAYARQAGISPAAFNACLRGGASATHVMADKKLGESLGVSGTPTLVLGVADDQGKIRPVKLVKAYDPPQKVLAEIETFVNAHPAPINSRTTHSVVNKPIQ